jgi:hypothetical protein
VCDLLGDAADWMEALVNAAYDRISEDVILLYDAFHAYEEVCLSNLYSKYCPSSLSFSAQLL